MRKNFKDDFETELTDLLESLAKQAGVDLFGVGDVHIGLAEELAQMPIAISLAVHNEDILRNCQGVNYYHYQQSSIDYKLESAQKLLVRFLRRKNYRAFAIPPDSDKMDNHLASRLFPLFPHKTAATCSGLGWIGKNGLLINKKYGPCLGWATVLTNAPLRVTSQPYHKGQCGKCRKCVDACPARAIQDREWVREQENTLHIDVERCMKHLEQNRRLYGEAFCGQCVINCLRQRELN